MSQNKTLRFFYLKIDNERYDQKFKTFEAARDFAASVHEHMAHEKKMVECVEIYDHKNKKIYSISK